MVSSIPARKMVSVLFCDLAGSTALGEQLDPEPLRELLTVWYEAMREAVERHGGIVEKFVGDAVMAVFGLPRAHEDDALRAVRAGLEMQEGVEEINSSLAGNLPELKVRIGINTGEVVTGGEAETLVTGDAVNTAKRLEEAAGAGDVLIGAVTERLVRHAMRLEQAAPVEAKGKSEPVEAWHVLEAIAGAEAFARRWDTPLVGRQRELGILRDEVTEAVEGPACRLVTIVAPAGVGKTRLAGEFVSELGDRATVLSGRCLPYGDGITFLPLMDLIRDLGGESATADAVREEPDAGLVLERVGALSAGRPGPPEELFWAVRRLFEALARPRPLVAVLEDIHWAEPMLLDLVEHVTSWSRDARILILCHARPELLEERPRWEGKLIRLEPLTGDEASQLLDALDDGSLLDPELRIRVAEAAHGNPLYAEQFVAMLHEGGTEAGSVMVPPTIQALLADRLDRLEPEERDVLERAAVIGREFWPGAVAALAEAGDAATGTTLHSLVRRELVEPAPSPVPGEDGFRFRHPLIREAAYGSAPLGRRAVHHERFAEWLASAGGEEQDELRGYHLEQAVQLRGPLGAQDERVRALAAQAHDLLGAAGTRAHARGDEPAARNLLERALALGPAEPDGTLELRRMLANALWETGETDRALELVEDVVAQATAIGDHTGEWYARLDSVGMRLIGGSLRLATYLETASQAVEVFEELGDEHGLALAWRRISIAERERCNYAASEVAAERALAYALRSGDRQDAARAADDLGTALLWGPAPVADAIERCNELLAEAEGNEPLRANVLTALAGLRALAGEVDEARRLRREAETIYRDLGRGMSIAGMTQIAAQIERLAGDAAAAEAELRRGLDILGDTGEAFQRACLAAALAAQGRYDEASEAAEAARSVSSEDDALAEVVWRGALARARAATGEVEEALALARAAVDRASVTDGLAMHAEALLDLAAVLDAAGEKEKAEQTTREAAALYERKGRVAPAAPTG